MSKIALLHTTEQRKKDTVEKIVSASSPVPTYFLLLILSIIIVTLGLVLNSVAIIIGGMLVSPLLSPILSFGMGIVISDKKLIYRSTYVLLKSIGITVLFAIIISFLSEFDINTEILSRTDASLSYFYVAVASGVAAAFSYIKEEFEERLVGVAIAIALLPPLAVTGIGISRLDPFIIFGSLELFIANFIGIILAVVIVFSLFKFHTVEKKADESLKKEVAQIAEYKKEKEEEKEAIKNELNGG